LISNASIVFLQKFTNVDTLFLEIIKKSRENGAVVWGDMDDIFHPDYIQYSGQALTGMWDKKQQEAISSGFMRVVSRLDTLLVSTPKIKDVFESDFPELKVLLRRNKIPERYMTRRTLPKIDTPSFRMIYPSGSLSHKKDFEPVSDILFEFLKKFKDCSLTLLGGKSVQVPEKLLARDNVTVLPAMKFSEMMDEIEGHDLLLAPLLINDFNNAKSNIKFIEAASVKVPVLTTSVSEFSTYIVDKKNGFLEDDFAAWGDRLIDFRRNPEMLSDAGLEAHKTVFETLTTNSLENELISEIKKITQPNIEKRYPNKSHQKYPNWLIEQNKYISTVGSSELIQRVNDYIDQKSRRGKARYVVYTCLSNNYDSLKVPEFLDSEVDYICFSDQPVYGYGVWNVKSYSQKIADPTRISRHPKLLPHLYLSDYEASLYMDANILPVQSMMSVFKGLSKSGAHVAGVIHPDRDCIYKEAAACKRSEKDDPKIIDKAMDYLRSKKFPENFGLFENNLIYRKHNEIDVIQAMELWWSMYSKYSKRDQLSYMFSLYQTGIKPKAIFIDQTRNVRKSSEFLYFSHGEDDVWVSKIGINGRSC
jgi:glycosyltransferase involved in cell wall biosynthesis